MTEARRLAEKEVLQPFDLTKAPLIRLKLYVLNKRKYLLLVVVHHTIADGWSLGVFLSELMFFYQKITHRQESLRYLNYLFNMPIMHIGKPMKYVRRLEHHRCTYWKKQLGRRTSYSRITDRSFTRMPDKLSQEEPIVL